MSLEKGVLSEILYYRLLEKIGLIKARIGHYNSATASSDSENGFTKWNCMSKTYCLPIM